MPDANSESVAVLSEISKKAGWRIFESNNVAAVDGANDTVILNPIFGIEGETFAAPIQQSLDLIPYMRDESVNKAFKGTFVFGGTCANSKKLGAAKVTVTLGSYT